MAVSSASRPEAAGCPYPVSSWPGDGDGPRRSGSDVGPTAPESAVDGHVIALWYQDSPAHARFFDVAADQDGREQGVRDRRRSLRERGGRIGFYVDVDVDVDVVVDVDVDFDVDVDLDVNVYVDVVDTVDVPACAST